MRERAQQILTRLRAEALRLSHHYLGPSQAVGLDIGADSAKAVHVRDLGERLEVALFGATPLRVEETALPPEATARRVRDLVVGWGFPTRRLVAGLSGQDCLVRRIKLPFADLKKAARIAPFELEHDLPVSPGEMVLELFPLSANGPQAKAAEALPEEGGAAAEAGGEAKEPVKEGIEEKAAKGEGLSALALVTTRQRLGERQSLLSAAGLAPGAIESDVLALYQAFRALHPAEQGSADIAAVIDFGARKTAMLVVRGPQLLALRTIPLGGDAVSRALAAHWQVGFAQAEIVKRERCSIVGPREAGAASPRRLEASGVICAALEPLLRELRRTLLTCDPEADPTGPLLRRLYLCGGASLLPGLDGHLSRELECPVRPLAASPHLILAAGSDPAQEALLPTALGLALRQLRRLSPVDFRRSELAPRQETQGLRVQLACIGAVLALTAALGLTDLHIRGSAREARLETLKARAEEIYRGAVPGKGAVPDPLRQMERKLKEAEADPLPDLGGAQEMLEVLRTVAAATSGANAKVKVTRLSVEAVSAQVEGQADSKETVTRFRMALLKTKLFKECTIKEGVSPKAGKVDFNLELKRA